MSASTGTGWAQLRQQARSLETQVRASCSSWLTKLTRPLDGISLPHLLTICANQQHPPFTDRRTKADRIQNQRALRKGSPPRPSVQHPLSNRHPARNPHKPTHPPPRLRKHPHRLSPQAKQPLPAPRSPTERPPRIRLPEIHAPVRPPARQPPHKRALRHRRLPCLLPLRRGRLHARRAQPNRELA